MSEKSEPEFCRRVAEEVLGWQWIAVDGVKLIEMSCGNVFHKRERQRILWPRGDVWPLAINPTESNGSEPLFRDVLFSHKLTPDIDANDDYLVLEHCQKTLEPMQWQKFWLALYDLQFPRVIQNECMAKHFDDAAHSNYYGCFYKPGDWSRAALASLTTPSQP